MWSVKSVECLEADFSFEAEDDNDEGGFVTGVEFAFSLIGIWNRLRFPVFRRNLDFVVPSERDLMFRMFLQVERRSRGFFEYFLYFY